MNRRSFLRTLALSAGGIALLGPELLVPKRTYFLPPAGGWLREDPYAYLMRHGAILGGPDLVTDITIWDWHDGRPPNYKYIPYPGGPARFLSVQSSEWQPMGELT